ncbi:MAG TPA: glycosyltransferase family 1 protein [Patescibacteria group bacterium]|nr:glycosyltransferase family 1 protein [Patescibacteria group bacterium]
MRILIDVRCLMAGRRTGVEEYTLNLLLNLFENDRKNQYILFFNSAKKPRFDFSIFKRFANVKIKSFKIPNKLLNLSLWYLGWPHIDRLVGGADIFFLPNIIFFGASKKVKIIMTVHDLSFERYPQYFSWKRRLWHVFINPKKICRRSSRIIAVSDSTKDDISRLYSINKKKISTVHSAVGEKFRIISHNDQKLIGVKLKYNLPFKFILSLATIEPRKNITGIIQAFNRLQADLDSDISKFKLVIAGSPGWNQKKIFKEIENSPYRDRIQIINFVEDCDKEYVLNLATLFVYVSFFEGFGFPPLEAMKCGVPVIASNNSSLPEIVGNGGILINPDKPDEIYRAMKAILTRRELREKLIALGQKKSNEFHWKKSSKQFLEIADKML